MTEGLRGSCNAIAPGHPEDHDKPKGPPPNHGLVDRMAELEQRVHALETILRGMLKENDEK